MEFLLHGLATGSIYALVAVGYALVYRTTGIVNFAQGSFVMIGGMAASWLLDEAGIAYPVAIVGGIALAGLTGLILWYLVVQPLWRRGGSTIVLIMATLVFSAATQDVVLHVVGSQPRTLPDWIPGSRVDLGVASVPAQYVLVSVATVTVIAMTAWFLRQTSLGRQMRASAADREVSRLLGISPERIGRFALVATAALGGLGGVLIAPAQYTSFDAGIPYGIFGFVAAVLGGFGSLPGALIGGLLLGAGQALVGRYISPDYVAVIVLMLLVAILAIRPRGILGGQLVAD